MKRKLLIALMMFLFATKVWAGLSIVDPKVYPADHVQQAVPSLTKLEYDVTEKSKTHAPEPATLALFGSGLLGMVVTFLRKTYALSKRILDIFLSILALIALTPLCIVVAVLIKLTSKGPIFFTQTRVGKDKQLFEILKFRTMRVDAEKETGPVWAQENDPRLIPIGKILRKSHIDEIPQFINVIRGEMSIIGPRPERPNFVDTLKLQVDGYETRLEVKPGITGLAQVKHRYDENIEDVRKKIKYDIMYIKNMCFWTDFQILIRTVKVVFTGAGAR